jgi:hypothetical protein
MNRLHDRLRRYRNEESGFAPLTMALGVSLLVIPVLLVVLTLPSWEERTVDAKDMAANAARILASASGWQPGITQADQTIAEMAANQGIPTGQINVSYHGSLNPGATITVDLTVTIPAGTIPAIGSFGTFHYTASSTQHIDSYKSENPGFTNAEGPSPSSPGGGPP